MSYLATPIQSLILLGTGVKPTIPTPSTIMPSDERFDRTSNIMVGQMAYNIDDDIWYYRNATSIRALNGGELTINDVESWQSNKVYRAGNVFVSYVNAGSANPQFQTEALYRCDSDTLAGESPETHEAKWVYQGQEINITNSTALTTSYDNSESILNSSNVKDALDELAAAGGGGLSQVSSDVTLNGLGTPGSPLAVANPFTVSDESKLDSIEDNAEVNNISDVNATDLTNSGDSTLHYHTSDRNRTNHTGTQDGTTVTIDGSGFDGNLDSSVNTVQKLAQAVDDLEASGGGDPGGADTQVQFNDGSSFGGDDGLTYNKTTNTLTGEVIKTGDHGTNTSPETVNIVYDTTGTPPSAASVPEGTIFIQYTA